MKEASFYHKKEDQRVDCFLCNHRCNIAEGKKGICQVRENRQGILYSLNYGKVVAANVDPIEKKPLFHFLPGSQSFSIAATGCNFKCDFCQNWEISQVQEAQRMGVRSVDMAPKEVVEKALKNNAPSISYTYTEPTIYFEFAYECSIKAQENGLSNVFVTNGFMGQEALRVIAPYLDAANVDLKSFRQDFYRKTCKGDLSPVLANIALMRELNIWVEVTTLLIPGVNDSDQELSDIASFLVSVDKDIPWHISAFHPDYQLTDIKRTSFVSLERAHAIGKEQGLNFVYMGNVESAQGENTYCPKCTQLLIERAGFFIKNRKIKNGACVYCQQPIKGVWQ
ncbi:MAG: AmmeMemoRadiSam system radical SAM enzyme [Candidatus Omnitrophica bacterium]|nr:AmmeMemoRadiSam system radical SAM enzyme [Candidatus Omnitrophota bacterium]